MYIVHINLNVILCFIILGLHSLVYSEVSEVWPLQLWLFKIILNYAPRKNDRPPYYKLYQLD